MTELDFDELDKAVNSLMGDVDTSKRNPGLDDPEDTVVTLAMNDVQPVTAPAAPAPSTSNPSLAVKRRGQFMDVIHPSSDMKVSPTKVNRQGATVEPSSPVIAPEPVQQPAPSADSAAQATVAAFDMESTGTATPPVGEVVQPTEAPEQPAPTPELPKSDWPDPIDLAMNEAAASDAKPESVADTPAATPFESAASVPSLTDASQESSAAQSDDIPTDVVEEIAQPSVELPLTSPFLPDAKVEKRPLGMPIPVGDNQKDDEAATPEATEADEVPKGEEPQTPPSVPLPSELQSDVLSLESSSVEAAPEPSDTSVASAASVAENSVPAGGSIPQQYAEQPSTSDQASTPIYDTSTHTQPLEQPKKKKSPVLLIVVVLVLALIGSLAGAAYYYFTH